MFVMKKSKLNSLIEILRVIQNQKLYIIYQKQIFNFILWILSNFIPNSQLQRLKLQLTHSISTFHSIKTTWLWFSFFHHNTIHASKDSITTNYLFSNLFQILNGICFTSKFTEYNLLSTGSSNNLTSENSIFFIYMYIFKNQFQNYL